MVSVIIVSYNTAKLTLKCLEAVFKSKGVELEVIVVDNNSTDGTVEQINKIFRDKVIKIIRNKKNLGFGTANNQGMKIARGEYILLLNSDCFIEEATLQQAQDNLVNADVLGCKLLNQDGSIQQSWGYFPTLRRIMQMMLFIDNLPFIRNFADSIHVRAMNRYNSSHEVDWVTGAFIFMKREVYEQSGGFDENFFMYGEEIEWQYRIKKQGFVIRFDPTLSAIHLVGASSPTRAPAVVGEIEGWKYWFAKYYPGWQEFGLRLIVLVGCGLRIILKPKWSDFYRDAVFALSK